MEAVVAKDQNVHLEMVPLVAQVRAEDVLFLLRT